MRGGNQGSRCRRWTRASSTSTTHLIPARGDKRAHHHYEVRFLVQAMEDRFRMREESRAPA